MYKVWRTIQSATHRQTDSERLDAKSLRLHRLTKEPKMAEALTELNTHKTLFNYSLIIFAKNIDKFEGSPDLDKINIVSKDFIPGYSSTLKMELEKLIAAKNAVCTLLEKNNPRRGIPASEAIEFRAMIDEYMPVALAKAYKYIATILDPANKNISALKPVLDRVLSENIPYAQRATQFAAYENIMTTWSNAHTDKPLLTEFKELIQLVQQQVALLAPPAAAENRREAPAPF